MSIKLVAVDLDGTLLPITQEDFSRVYFGLLMQKGAEMGIDRDKMKAGLFGGIKAMVTNHGNQTNEEAFWQVFSTATETDRNDTEPVFREFYKNEFIGVKSVVKPTETSVKLIKTLKEKGYRIILATNPLFPIEAIDRITWVGLKVEDFDYITTYENSSYCKPNPDYYTEILEKNNLKAEDCLMVGNNATEDMAAEKIGIKTYLVTDVLENEQNLDISAFENGSLEDFYKKAQEF